MANFPMRVSVHKMPKNPDMFEFTIATPVLRTQFQLPRRVTNELRIIIEKALKGK